MNYPHERPERREDKGYSPGAQCDGEMLPSFSTDEGYDRFQCVICGLGVSIKKKA